MQNQQSIYQSQQFCQTQLNFNGTHELQIDLSIKNLPFCLEKQILQISSCISDEQISKDQKKSQTDKLIKEWEEKKELKYDRSIYQNLAQASSLIKNDNFENGIKELKKILKMISPINTTLLQELLENLKEASERINNKDVILLLGETGVGKSTTLHYLAGTKLIKAQTKIKGENNEEIYIWEYLPEKNQNLGQDLDKVEINGRASSVTRYIQPIKINTQNLNDGKILSICICDTPGFCDTAGAEQDIANIIQVVNALQKAKSVRPLIVSGRGSIGERGQHLVKFMKTLSKMIPNITDYISSFSYVFTKFPEEDQVKGVLTNIKQNSDQLDSETMTLINDMIQKSGKQNLKLNIEDAEQRNELLSYFLKIRPIDDPKSAFKHTLSSDSEQILKEKAQQNKIQIQDALRKQNFEYIHYKMNEFYYLKQILNEQYVELNQNYQSCQEQLINYLNKLTDDAINIFNDYILNGNKLGEVILNQYRECQNNLRDSEQLRIFHLNKQSKSKEQMTQNLLKQMDYMLVQLTDLDKNLEIIAIPLYNMKILSIQFEADCKLQYENAIQICQQYLQKQVEIAKQDSEIFQFNKLSITFQKIAQSILHFKDHLSKQELSNYKQQIIDYFFEQIISKLNQSKQILIKDIFDEQDIQNLVETAEIFQNAIDTHSINSFIEISKLQLVQKDFQGEIYKIVDRISEKLKISFNGILEQLEFSDSQATQLKQLELYLQQINLIRTVPRIKQITQERYELTLGLLENFVKDVKQKVMETINSLDTSKGTPIALLRKYLLILKETQWFDKYKEDVLKRNFTDILQTILGFARAKEIQSELLVLELSEHSQLLIARNILNQMDELLKLSHLFQDLKKIIVNYDNLKQNLKGKIERTLQKIADTYCLEIIGVKQYKQKLEKLQQIREQYNYAPEKQPTFNFLCGSKSKKKKLKKEILKEEGFNNINDLQDKIDFTSQMLKENSDEFFLFEDLNIQIAEDSEQYLRNCSDLAQNLEIKQFSGIQINFTTYLKRYSFGLEQQFINIFKKIEQEMHGENQFTLQQYSHKLLTNLKKMDTIRKTTILSKVSNITQFETCVQQLKKFADEIRNQNQQQRGEGNVLKIRRKQIIIQTILTFREYLGDVSDLQKLASDMNQNFNEKMTQQVAQILESLNKQNFDHLIDKILMLKLAYEEDEQYEIAQTFLFNLEQCEKNVKQECLNLMISQDQLSKLLNCVNGIEKLKKITKNFQKIKIQICKDYLQEETNKILLECIQETSDILKDKVIKYLKETEALMNTYNFQEAELRKDFIDQLKFLLSKTVDQDLIDQIKSHRQQCFKILDKFKENFQKQQIHDYQQNKPVEILNALKIVQQKDEKYHQVYQDIRSTINKNIQEFINQSDNNEIQQQEQQMQFVQQIQENLPDDIKEDTRQKVDLKLKRMEEQKNQKVSELQELSMQKELNIDKLKKFIEDCKKQKMNQFAEKATKLIEQKFQNHKQQLDKLIDENKITDFFSEIQKIENQPLNEAQTEQIQESKKRLSKIINNLSNQFKNIDTIADFDQLSENYHNITLLSDFASKQKNQTGLAKELNIENLKETADEQITTFLGKLNNEAIESINQSNFDQGFAKLQKLKQYNQFLLKYKKGKSFSEIKTTQEISNQISENFRQVQSEVLEYKLNTGNEAQKRAFYLNLESNLKKLKQVKIIEEFINTSKYDPNSFDTKLKPFFRQQISSIEKDAFLIIDLKDRITQQQFDKLQCILKNLEFFAQFQKIIEIEIDQTLQQIEIRILDSVEQLKDQAISQSNDAEVLAKVLIKIKTLSTNIPKLKTIIDQNLDKLLTQTLKNKDGIFQCTIISHLEHDQSPYGNYVLEEHKHFQGQNINKFVQETQKQDINYVLEQLTGANIDKEVLKKLFDEFQNHYNTILLAQLAEIDKNRKNEVNEVNEQVIKLAASVKTLIPSVIHPPGRISWDKIIRSSIPELMARLFSIWTVQNLESYFMMKGTEESQRKNYLLCPHPGQIISIFRILGLGYTKSQDLINNLVQIGTGEGKSVTLAITCSIFALLQVEVFCACYSPQLSVRDYQQFYNLFKVLGIHENIHYGTFENLCEHVINQECNVRQKIVDLIQNDKNEVVKDADIQRPNILIIDEVDVFFNESFYGQIYKPMARIKDPVINQLVRQLWSNRSKRQMLKDVKERPEYKACLVRFPKWQKIIDICISNMLHDLESFDHEYIVFKDKIAYKSQDGISTKIIMGYKTMFLYFLENEKHNISTESLEDNISFDLGCGYFSYAEIPYLFLKILGVSGTLKHLEKQEEKIIKKDYSVEAFTFMPSVFGKNNLKFAEKADVFVENKDNYYMRLADQITSKLGSDNTRRAIFVFFENKQTLESFKKVDNIAHLYSNIQIITEEVGVEERNLLIKRATLAGQVTFFTRIFGRGIDFICRDKIVLDNGGIHVIQTFLSEDMAEQIQIMGRTARQGQQGSFSLILLEDDLEPFLGVEYRVQIQEMREKDKIYEILNSKRSINLEKKYQQTQEFIQTAKKEHELAVQFKNYILRNQIDNILQYLIGKNMKERDKIFSRTICLMDATGSMSQLLRAAMQTVGTMFERAQTILQDNGLSKYCFELQFAIYRDYDQMKDGILNYSGWESSHENLQSFMSLIKAVGGEDVEEAIEVGLQHAYNEVEKNNLSQIILIGDAPAKSEEVIREYRSKYKGDKYWTNNGFPETHYLKEVNKLKGKNIPIHCFYLHQNAKANFTEIANLSKGECSELKINTENGADTLTKIVTVRVLQNIGNSSGRGDALVQAYEERFAKGHI